MRFFLLSITVVVLFVLTLFFGSVNIPAADVADILAGGRQRA